MTAEVAEFLLVLLGNQTVSVGAPDFEVTVGMILRARRELEGERHGPLSEQP